MTIKNKMINTFSVNKLNSYLCLFPERNRSKSSSLKYKMIDMSLTTSVNSHLKLLIHESVKPFFKYVMPFKIKFLKLFSKK